MAARKRITIRQVAREAGVSTQTVSRVINDRPDVAPETRLRVQRVISRLGYQPSAIARSLIHQRSHTIGVVATGLDYYGPSQTLVGIERQIRALGYSLLLDLLHHPETADVERITNRLLSHHVDGILWAVAEIGNNRTWLQRHLPHLSVPIVFLTMQPRSNLAVVSIDNRIGGYYATRHLLEEGYQNIGIVLGPLSWWEVRQRQLGWREALEAMGKKVEDRQIAEGDWSAPSGEAAMRNLLAQFPEMDAVFVCNDQMALGALMVAHQVGRRVPGDLGVVGFDDIPEASYFFPPLTTVRQPLVDLGRAAVNELNRMIDAYYQNESQIYPRTVWLRPELIVRRSSVATGEEIVYS